MVKELFDLLDREGLARPDNLEEQMARYSLTEIADLDQHLADIVKAHDAVGSSEVTGFDFWPNGDLAGLRGCQASDCRLRRVDHLVRFAVMWADSLYIPSYFGVTPRGRIEELWREWLYGSVSALLVSRPAIEAGIIQIVPHKPIRCPIHDPDADPEIKGVAETLAHAEELMQKEYRDAIEVTFETGPGRKYGLWISGPEDLFPHGGVGRTTDPNHCGPPAWLPEGVKKRASAGKVVHYHVPKSRIPRSGILPSVIHPTRGGCVQ